MSRSPDTRKLFAAAALVSAGGALAAEAVLVHDIAPPHPRYTQLTQMAAEVARRTQGTLTIAVNPGGKVALSSNLPALYLRPVLRADVYSRNPRQYLASYSDDFSVTKDCDLEYSIANDQDIPWDATVTWVVRNQGGEAGKVNDLGHTARGARRLQQHEVTKYAGSHYMDCIVTRNLDFLGMSSIRVTITDRAFKR